MLVLIGAAVVLGSVIGGFMLAGGEVLALYQPSELLVIGGAAIGSMLISTPMSVLKRIISQLTKIFSSGFSKQDYLDVLVMMYEVFNVARKDGLVGLENHIEHPDESDIFKRYPTFLKNHHALNFFSDTMRVIISGSVQPHDLEELMDTDIQSTHEEETRPGAALANVADSLPGLGIVAAVLGVVITMAAIDGPVEEIGHHVAAALVGTFLGVLGCYGFVGPLANNLKNQTVHDFQYLTVMKHALLSFHKGVAGVIAVEFARRTLPDEVRPGFVELEEACNAAKRR